MELFGSRFPLPPTCAEAADRDCLLGLRPEHFQVAMERMEGAVPAELDAVTPLNVRAVLLLKTQAGEEVLASCSEADAMRFPRGHRAVWARPAMDDGAPVRPRERRADRAPAALRESRWRR